MKNSSRILKASKYSWQGVDRKDYKTDSSNFKDVHRYTLLGEDIPELNFHTRYFEVAPGGYSSLEHHRHPHSVVIIRGNGSMILGNQFQELNLHDVIYIAPGTIHQFYADRNEPLGFLCMVDRYRDKPAIPDDETVQEQISNPDVLQKIKK
jgi:quercetin dioxygenase-like cupin family protein